MKLSAPGAQVLGRFFDLPLHEAAVQLGISATAMKSACRFDPHVIYIYIYIYIYTHTPVQPHRTQDRGT
jgi:hypothetical protein